MAGGLRRPGCDAGWRGPRGIAETRWHGSGFLAPHRAHQSRPRPDRRRAQPARPAACRGSAPMTRTGSHDRVVARRLLLAGLLIGVLAEVVLDGPALRPERRRSSSRRSSVAGWLLRRPGRAPDPLDAWLPVTALVLAAFVAVRGGSVPGTRRHDRAPGLHRRIAGRLLGSGGHPAVGVGGRGDGRDGGSRRRVAGAARAIDPRLRPDARHSDRSRIAVRRWSPLGRGLLLGLPDRG